MLPSAWVARRRMLAISSSTCSGTVFTGPKLGEREVERVEAVERGEVADEILRDAHLLVGVLDPIEPRLSRDAFRQHRFVHRMHGKRAWDRDVGVLQRHEDLGLRPQRQEQAAGRLWHAAVAQEQRDFVAVALHVDEPRLAARAAGYPLRGRDLPARHFLDPFDEVVGEVERGVRHGAAEPNAAPPLAQSTRGVAAPPGVDLAFARLRSV